MGFSCGLVGLPNAGKSTIFNALSNAGARVESYPFCTIEANAALAPVPDRRLDELSSLFPDKKRVPTRLEFVDIAGLVEHASQGEGMGNQFLAEIRNVDAVCHVVRCFEDENVTHVIGHLDPARDLAIVQTELLLKDYETLERVAKRLRQEAKGKDRKAPERAAAWDRLLEHVASGKPVRSLPDLHIVDELLRETAPLTAKPCLYVANVGDHGADGAAAAVRDEAAASGAEYVEIRGRLEAEVAEATDSVEERVTYLSEYGLDETGLSALVQAGYRLLDLITFFTFEGPEVRAWTIRRGATAPQAGGRIHSDFEERFVLAEIMDLDELVAAGSDKPLREAGRIRRAGHDHVIGDGDVIRFISS